MTFLIRELNHQDFEQWRGLWQKYLSFYETTLADNIYTSTFDKLVDNKIKSQNAFVAVKSEKLIGLVHFILKFRTTNLKPELDEGIAWIKSLEYAGWFLIYVIVVPIIGYLLATIIVAPCLTYRIGYRDKKMVAYSILTGFSIVLIFKTFLEVKIPGGAIYEFLPNAMRTFMILNF